jgi:heme/copper-type cytochrome/quinol oxidase subunit 3
MKKNLFSLLLPLLIAACIIAILTVLAWDALRTKHIEPFFVMVANAILLLKSCLNIFFQQVNLTKSNPQAVMRGIIGATMFKLFFLASVVIVYLVAAGEKRSVYAILVSMGCYIVYSWIETRISLQMKSNK